MAFWEMPKASPSIMESTAALRSATSLPLLRNRQASLCLPSPTTPSSFQTPKVSRHHKTIFKPATTKYIRMFPYVRNSYYNHQTLLKFSVLSLLRAKITGLLGESFQLLRILTCLFLILFYKFCLGKEWAVSLRCGQLREFKRNKNCEPLYWSTIMAFRSKVESD